jgi:hypothetical protein
MNRTFKVQLYFILIIAVLWGCRTTYEEVMHYESYYDENHLKKKLKEHFITEGKRANGFSIQ